MNDKLLLERVSPEDLERSSSGIIGAEKLLPQAEFLCSQGITYVAKQGDNSFLLMGVFPLWTGVGEGWALNRDGFNFPIFTARAFRKVAREAFSVFGLHRLQLDFNASVHKSCGMPFAVGFKTEGIMRGFTIDRQDCIRMAILKEDLCR